MGIEFSPEELEADAVTADTPAAEPTPADRSRDEAGRFAPTQQEEGGAEDAQQQQRRTVPHAALHAEREGHKSTKAQLAQAQDQLRQLSELRQRLAGAAAPQIDQPAPAAPLAPATQPDEDDPTGVKHLTQRLSQLEQQTQQRQARDAETGIASQEQSVLHNQLIQSENQFRQATPDYDSAAQHLARSRISQLEMMGLGPVEVQQTLAQEVLEITRAAIEQGRSPAEVAYAWAQTYGYQPQQAQQQQVNPMLAAITQGQKQSRTLATGRGGAGIDQVNADAIARMSESEFQQLYNTPQGRALIDSLG